MNLFDFKHGVPPGAALRGVLNIEKCRFFIEKHGAPGPAPSGGFENRKMHCFYHEEREIYNYFAPLPKPNKLPLM